MCKQSYSRKGRERKREIGKKSKDEATAGDGETILWAHDQQKMG